MVLGGALAAGASAWMYADTAYKYNTSRFQFNSDQAQKSAHQMMHLRIAQWQLFREDIRELFSLTTNHMMTYMVMCSLFVGFSVLTITASLATFPTQPAWLLLCFGNCYFACLAYGIVSVWFAIHGAIAAQSASVQMLTQAIRPPIPTAEEVANAGADLATFESAGVTVLAPPDLLGLGGAPTKKNAAAVEQVVRSRGSDARSFQPSASFQPSVASFHAASFQPSASFQAASASFQPGVRDEQAADTQQRVVTALHGDDGGPGTSAAFHSHVKLFQALQSTYASYDAYSRVTIDACASQMLMCFCYFWMGSILATEQRQHISWAAELASIFFVVNGVGTAMLTSMTVLRLDLYVHRAQMHFVKITITVGPVMGALAAILWRVDEESNKALIMCLVLTTCILHIMWIFVFLYEARPTRNIMMLPTSFRSVKYLDVFGSFENAEIRKRRQKKKLGTRGVTQDDHHDVVDSFVVDAGLECSKLHRKIEKLIMMGQDSHFSEEEMSQLSQLSADVLAGTSIVKQDTDGEPDDCGSLWSSVRSAGTFYRPWYQCEFFTDAGERIPYFVHMVTEEVRWDQPSEDQIIKLSTVKKKVAQLQKRTRQLDEASLNEEDGDDPIAEDGWNRVFQVLPKRPGSRFDQASMPWRYFRQISLGLVIIWCIAIIFCLDVLVMEIVRPMAQPNTTVLASRVAIEWPHGSFRPSGLTCAGYSLGLGDRYEIHSTDLTPVLHQWGNGPKLLPVLQAQDLTTSWKSIAWMSCPMPQCSPRFFLLESSGMMVVEHRAGVEANSWVLGPAMGTLTAIAPAGQTEQDICSRRHAQASWTLLGATTSKRVVLLCPIGKRLEAIRTLLAIEDLDGEIAGVHSAGGIIWMLVLGVGSGRLQAWTEDRSLSWRLPGHHWAPGLCALPDSHGFLVGTYPAPLGSKQRSKAEMWRILPEVLGLSSHKNESSEGWVPLRLDL